jgi:hypothetical protein
MLLRKRFRGNSGQFQERFRGKMSLIDKDGHIGVMARSSAPIQKDSSRPVSRKQLPNSQGGIWGKVESSPKNGVSDSYVDDRSPVGMVWKKKLSIHQLPELTPVHNVYMKARAKSYTNRSAESGADAEWELRGPCELQKVLVSPYAYSHSRQIKSNDIPMRFDLANAQVRLPVNLPYLPATSSHASERAKDIQNVLKEHKQEDDHKVLANRIRYRAMLQKLSKPPALVQATPPAKATERVFRGQIRNLLHRPKGMNTSAVVPSSNPASYPWFSPMNHDAEAAYDLQLKRVFGHYPQPSLGL